MNLDTRSHPVARRSAAIAVFTLLLSTLASVAPAMAAPTIGGTVDASYVEGAAATPVATSITVADGIGYGGQYLEFSITDATTGEILGLVDDGVAATANGVVSVVGSSIYLGNGATADAIGSIDDSNDGIGGSPLRVNFTSAFENSGFETGDLSGWTPITQQVDLGYTTIAGCPTVDTSTYPGTTTNEDNNTPSTLGSLATPIVTDQASEGTHSLRLVSSGMTTLVGFDVVHGPAVYSDPFEAAAGDTIYFDWLAFAGGDDFHVFGYIIDESCNQTELLDATGSTTSWTTKPTVIPSSGTYRFVFVSGTFDASGGRAAGASLYIDNVQVFGTKATDAVAQAVARKVTYRNTDEESPTSRTLNITAQSASQGSSSASLTINVDTDPATTSGLTVTPGDGEADLSWSAPDPGGSAITDYIVQYSSDGGSTWTTFNDGVSTSTSTTVTGLTNGTEYVFRVAAVNDAGPGPWSTHSSPESPASIPGAPSNTAPTAGDAEVALAWDAPADDGGNAINDYVIQYSDDGGATWTTFNDGVSTATSATVTGLTNGTEYVFHVAAVNTIGSGPYGTQSSAAMPVGAPLAPADLDAVGDNAEVGLSWTAPSNSGAAITDYVIQYSDDGGSTWTTFNDGVSTTTSTTVTGLTNGTEYVFHVAAVNTEGTGPYSSESAAVTPATVPDAPANPQATYGDGETDLSWDAPGGDGGNAITDYVIQYSDDDGSTWTTFNDGVSTATSTTVTGLDNGTEYVFQVAAVNSVGAGAFSASTEPTVPKTVPDAPDTVNVTAGVATVDLTWNPPGDGGDAITDYVIQYSDDGGSTWTTFNDGTSTTTSATVTGLTNGTEYVFHVAAVNTEGAGPYSAASTAVTPATVPDPPTGIQVAYGNSQVAVNWDAPAYDGGDAITDYVIQYSDDGGSTWTTFDDGTSTATSATVTGLTNGTEYVFHVAAVNNVGEGTHSSESNPVTPKTVPGSPLHVSVVAGDKQVVLSWDAPEEDGGSPITDYVIESKADGASWVTYPDGVSVATESEIGGLDNGASYVFRVSAVNAIGAGPGSVSAAVTPELPGPEFEDAVASVFSSDIEWMRQKGITQGCNPPVNSAFCPETPLTRAEMATFLDRWLGFAPTSVDYFVDDDGSIHEDALNRAAAAGVFRGCNPPENNLVCPDEIITRGQAAAVLVRALGITSDEPIAFRDIPGTTFEREIGVLGAFGITRGSNPPENDLYYPDQPVTRGQMAAMLHRAAELS